MNDTRPEVQRTLDVMFAALSPAQRVRMMSGMFDTMRRLLASGIRAEQPEISEAELRVQMFLRLYRNDFTREECERIVAAIRAAA